MKVHRRNIGIAPLALNSALNGSVLTSRSGSLMPLQTANTHWTGGRVGPKTSLCVLENRKIFCPTCWYSNRKLSGHHSSPLGSPTCVNEEASLTSDPEDIATQKQNFRNDSTCTATKTGRASITATFARIYKSVWRLIPEECNFLQDICYNL
jgi:hypothetical protein